MMTDVTVKSGPRRVFVYVLFLSLASSEKNEENEKNEEKINYSFNNFSHSPSIDAGLSDPKS